MKFSTTHVVILIASLLLLVASCSYTSSKVSSGNNIPVLKSEATAQNQSVPTEVKSPLPPPTGFVYSESYIPCAGKKFMDGTVLIQKEFCGSPEDPLQRQCQKWLEETKRGLGQKLVRATECTLQTGNDIAGCQHVASAQVTCRFSENLDLMPASCIDHIGDINESADELRNCLSNWAFRERGANHHEDLMKHDFSQLKTFSPRAIEVYECVSRDWKMRNNCIYDIAQKYKDSRFCHLNTDPYSTFQGSTDDRRYRKSRPNCLKELGASNKD